MLNNFGASQTNRKSSNANTHSSGGTAHINNNFLNNLEHVVHFDDLPGQQIEPSANTTSSYNEQAERFSHHGEELRVTLESRQPARLIYDNARK